jgi:hypothetical protein
MSSGLPLADRGGSGRDFLAGDAAVHIVAFTDALRHAETPGDPAVTDRVTAYLAATLGLR